MRLNRKTILITGGTGSLGNKLVEKLLLFKPKEIRILSRSETLQDQMRFKFPNLKYILGDIRDYRFIIFRHNNCGWNGSNRTDRNR